MKREVQEEALDGQNIHQQPDPQQDPLLNPCRSEVRGLVHKRYTISSLSRIASPFKVLLEILFSKVKPTTLTGFFHQVY